MAQTFAGQLGREVVDIGYIEGGSTSVDAGSPGHGVSTAVTSNDAVLIATVEVGKRYRVTCVGGEGVVVACDDAAEGDADRTTDEPLWPGQKIEVVAAETGIWAQKLVSGTADCNVVVTPLDGGTVS